MIEMQVDGLLVEIDEKVLQLFIELKPDLVKRCYLKANGYPIEMDKTGTEFINGLWTSLKCNAQRPDGRAVSDVASVRQKRLQQIESNYKAR
ncbi:MAG: hypothetical protein KME38_08990 [Spirirestis rafaelensis WJT71-NPBG6]|jgi:hypothetical protein|nr:hypothetical protein [Spirirestis rafaelensis WJT71-NPBG6]